MLHKFFIFITILTLTSCVTKEVKTPSIIELVDMDYRFSTATLTQFCRENKIETSSVYQWQNHWVIYRKQNASELAEKIEKKFPKLKVNVYETPFYDFNREKMTGSKPANEWTNIIMTANLVADTTLQHQYLEYHRTQFEKWPEVSKGFCKADFQQLLVFRNGRQLMLVISIPKGKTLDELNPKTTDNNPRVDEWNKIMVKYQEGIEDAPKSTTWVAFSSIKN
ncbi:MAG: L-rhamnose mutarotase [Paludibacter sp.]|nr:L-rhamnose mutarotase [Paludibacter sp.]